MDQGLFQKYAQALQKQVNEKEEIITFIEQETGVHLTNEEIVLEKNKIQFQTSSVKKVLLRKKSIADFFLAKKIIIKF